MKDKLLNILKIIISLGLIIYLFSRVDMKAVGATLARANVLYFIVALILYFGAVTVGCVKWKLLLNAQGIEVPFVSLLSFTFVGLFFGNFVLPIVAGDVVRGYDLARYTTRAAEAAVSVFVDKLVGLIAFLIAATVMSLLAVFVVERADLMNVAVIMSITCAVFLIGFASLLSRRLRALGERILQLPVLSIALPLYRKLSNSLQAYRHNYLVLGQATLISLTVILITNVVNYLLFAAVAHPIPWFYIFLFNPMAAFAPILIPSLGGLGVNQGVYQLLYSTIGGVAPADVTLSAALLMQLIIYLSSLPGGLLWWRGKQPKNQKSA